MVTHVSLHQAPSSYLEAITDKLIRTNCGPGLSVLWLEVTLTSDRWRTFKTAILGNIRLQQLLVLSVVPPLSILDV